MHDLGWTHIALPAFDLDASIAFYGAYAGLVPVHDRTSAGQRVVWLCDARRPFVLVLAQSSQPVAQPLGPFAHLGIAVESRDEVDALVRRARAQGRSAGDPEDLGPPIGYVAFIRDPDGHTVEFSYGQDVGLTLDNARTMQAPR